MRLFVLFTFLITQAVSFGQDGIKADQLQNIIPASPNAASLGKYGEIPIGLYNGVPDISVPIHQVVAGRINLPISLSYHAAGIKVEETASSVGLGWALNAGGTIVRQTRGLPDDNIYGYLYTHSDVERYINHNMTYTEEDEFRQGIANGTIDTEPDMFFYNIGGLSGKFYLDETGVAVTIPKSTIKIELTGGTWEITDNNGIHYLFGQTESTTSVPVSGQIAPGGVAIGDPHTSITAWHVSRIFIPGTNFEVLYEYENFTNEFFTLAPQTRYVFDGVNQECNSNPPEGVGALFTNYVSCKRLTKIIGIHEIVDFIYSPLLRLDLETDKALEKVKITPVGSTQFKQAVLQYNGLSNQQPGQQYGLNMYQNRLFLQSVSITSDAGVSGGQYQFFYNTGSLPSRLSYNQDLWGYFNGSSNSTWLVPTTTLVSSTGTPISVAGGDRLVRESFAKFGILEKVVYPTGGSTEFNFEGNDVSSYTYLRSTPNQGYVSVGSQLNGFGSVFETPEFTIYDNGDPNNNLQECQLIVNNGGCGGGMASLECPMISIIGVDNSYNAPANYSGTIYLPPGKYKIVLDLSFVDPFSTYFTNSYAELYFPLQPLPATYQQFQLKAGGLRIKSMITKDFDGNIKGQKYYDYKQPGTSLSSGSISQLPEYLSTIEYQRSTSLSWGGTAYFNCKYISLSSTSNYPLANTKGGIVGYAYVKETEELSGAKGYTENFFTSPATHPDELMNAFPYPPAKDNDWKRGMLTKEVKWQALGNSGSNETTYKKIAEKEITYTTFYTQYYSGLKHGQRTFNQTSSSLGTGGSWLEFMPYQIVTGIYVPTKEINKAYDVLGNVSVSETNSIYNGTNYMVSAQNQKNSKGEVIETIRKYPHDYPVNDAVSQLYVENRRNELLEQIVTNTSLTKELSRQKVTYQKYSQFSTSFAEPFKISSSTNGNLLQDDLTVLQRDINKNVLEAIGKDGIKVVFIYGYNNTLPVAKITGSDLATVQSVINTTSIQSLTGSALKNALLPLCNLSLTDVRIYTHKRGIGIDSETNQMGQTTSYYYDGLGRLSKVVDFLGNIIKQYCYNFKGDVISCN